MNIRTLLLGWLLVVGAITLALPTPENDDNSNSLGQHLGRTGLWVLASAAIASLAFGSISYGTNWWHRFKLMQADHEGNMTSWKAMQGRKERHHQKQLQGLDVILEVARNFTEAMGKENSGVSRIGLPEKPKQAVPMRVVVRDVDKST
jgi:hypothetical protein